MELIIKKCVKCGALVEVLKDCTCDECGIMCCGEEMKILNPNSVEASFEKHMPVVDVVDNEIIVKVPHVMEEQHYIEWIAVVDKTGIQKRMLEIGNDAFAKFPYRVESKVYSYCNLHGLWMLDVK